MLPRQKWRADAIVRFLVSIFICIYMGTIASGLYRHFTGPGAKSPFLWVAMGGLLSLAAALVLVRLPLTRENIVHRAGATLVCFYIGLMLTAWAQNLAGVPKTSVANMVISGISFQGATIVLTFLFVSEQNTSWAAAFGLNDRPGHAILVGIALGLAFLPIGWGLQLLSVELMQRLPWFPITPVEQQSVQTLRHAQTGLHKIVLAVTTIALAPAAEELLFRGVLYKWIRDGGFQRLALWGLSLLFAGVHFNTATFLPLVLLSVVLTILYERTGNLLAPVAAHASFNAMNFGLLYIMQRQMEF